MKTTFLFAIAILLQLSAIAGTKYVSPTGSGARDGSSWADACDSSQLQSLINSSTSGTDIWVARGTYYPTAYPAAVGTQTNRDYTFSMKTGVNLYGGFTVGDTALSQRDTTGLLTILSGDIMHTASDSDNVYHVVLFSRASATLDGFTVTKGFAYSPTARKITFNSSDSVPSRNAGGVFLQRSTATLRHCRIQSNTAYTYGGGMEIVDGSTVTIAHTTVLNNVTTNTVSVDYGGGLSIESGSTVSMSRCQVLSNVTNTVGAGISCYKATIIATACFFVGNYGFNGGAACVFGNGARGTFQYCVIAQNYALFQGGGITIDGLATGDVEHCTFYSNTRYGSLESDMYNAASCTFGSNIVWAGSNAFDSTIVQGVIRTCNLLQRFNPSPFISTSVTGPDNILGTNDDGLQLDCSRYSAGALDMACGGMGTDILGHYYTNSGPPDMGAYEAADSSIAPVIDSIGALVDSICTGSAWTPSAFAAHSTTSYVAQWSLNGGAYTYTSIPAYALHTGDSIRLRLTNTGACNHGVAYSIQTKKVYLKPTLNPTVTLTNHAAIRVCGGSPVTYSATSTDAGSNPTYSWYAGSSLLGTTTAPSYTWANPTQGFNGRFKVIMATNYACSTPATKGDSANLRIDYEETAPVISFGLAYIVHDIVINNATYTGSTGLTYFKDGQRTTYTDFRNPSDCGSTYYCYYTNAGTGCVSPNSNTLTFTIPQPHIHDSLGTDLLVVSPWYPNGNQWYKNGVAIPGEVYIPYEPLSNGDYTCRISYRGCTPAPSNIITISSFVENPVDTDSILHLAVVDIIKTPVRLYPNPAQHKINIDLGGELAAAIRMLDMTGREVLTIQSPTGTTVDVSRLAEGTYLAEVTMRDGTIRTARWTRR